MANPRFPSVDAAGKIRDLHLPDRLSVAGVDAETARLVGQTDTATHTALNTMIGSAPLTVYHGDIASTARPDTPRPVFWVGSIMPDNRLAGDIVALARKEWSPDHLDLLGWYDATQEESTGGALPVLHDQGPRGHDLYPASGAGVTLGTMGGRAAYDFPGNLQGLYTTDSAGYDPALWEGTVTVLAACTVTNAENAIVFDSAHSSPTARLQRSGAGNTIGINYGTLIYAPDDLWPLSETVVVAAHFTRTQESFGTMNGATVVGPGDAGMPATQIMRHRLGGGSAGGDYFQGDIGEVIVAKDMTAADRAAAQAYLMEKWGVA